MDHMHWKGGSVGHAASGTEDDAWGIKLQMRLQIMHKYDPCGNGSGDVCQKGVARVYGMLLTALEDVSLGRRLWTPAHKSAAHVGKVQLSNDEVLTEEDVSGNDEADEGAKE